MGKRSAQDFDCNLTVEPCIAGAPDLAHPACAERRQDMIVTEARVGGDCHSMAS